MRRSWSLLGLAFIVLISLSSVCTIPVNTNPQSSPSNKVPIQWVKPAKLGAPTGGPGPGELERAQSRIRKLMLEAADVLGLDKSPPPEVVYDLHGGVSFKEAYRLNGFVKFRLFGGTKFAGKEVLGLIYIGSDKILMRWDAKLFVDREEVFPKKS
ncbi:hypothetical protein DFJ43DRAFT_1108727 [Lentinula guzmanii]|uniref:Uncharacterized protein n=1 Tax=Lentinula guzmanii TaxID=2804957 RepID=A0AA38J937_9AGAR|nr:hypothetical protein DFJ43DRAFT_1108727 [Lentinula guzmanii]